ncbi:hypothetical protein ACHAPE_003367 [Trichoderma viride]
MSMFRSLRKKTGSVFRKRKDKSSVSSVTSVPSISWPLPDDSYPPSIATEEQPKATIDTASHTAALVEEERKQAQEQLSEVQKSNNTVVDIVVTVTDPSASHTTAVHIPAVNTLAVDTPAVDTPAVDIPVVTTPAVNSTIVDIPAVALEDIPIEAPAQEEVQVAEEEPKMDSYTPKKFVPFVETSAMRNNMFVYPASSHYGMVNPAIMSGFGDEDDDSIWLVDDEETDPEAESAQTPEADEEGEEVVQVDEGDYDEEGSEEYDMEEGEEEDEEVEEEEVEAEEDEEVEEEEVEAEEDEEVEEEEVEAEEAEASTSVSLPRTSQSQPPSVHSEPETAPIADAQTGFRYRFNLALLDDDFATPEEDKNSVPTTYRRNRNMAASSGSSTPAIGNPYVDLLEQQDSAMTEAYQRRLDLSGRRGDDEADDFR